MSKTKITPKVGVPLSDDELIKALTKLPDEGDPHINDEDRTMSNFVMDRIDQSFTIPQDFVYEVMIGGVKKYWSIHGDAVHAISEGRVCMCRQEICWGCTSNVGRRPSLDSSGGRSILLVS